MERLDQLVSTDAEVRRLYLNYVNLCASLRWSHQEKDEQQASGIMGRTGEPRQTTVGSDQCGHNR